MIVFNTVDSYLTIWNFVSMAFKRSWWLFFLKFLPFETVFFVAQFSRGWPWTSYSPATTYPYLRFWVCITKVSIMWCWTSDSRASNMWGKLFYNWAPSYALRGSPYVILFFLSFSPTFLISYHLNLEYFSLWFLSIPYNFPPNSQSMSLFKIICLDARHPTLT